MTKETKQLNLKIIHLVLKIYLVLCLILFLATLSLKVVIGLTIGTIFSIINFYLLSLSVEKAIEKKFKSTFYFIMRVLLFAVIVKLYMKYQQHINFISMVAGFLIVQIGIVISNIKFKKRREKDNGK